MLQLPYAQGKGPQCSLSKKHEPQSLSELFGREKNVLSTVKSAMSGTSGNKGLLDISVFWISECYA
jgi:hypothetical protein